MGWWFEKILTMAGTAAFGLLGQWFLQVKFPNTPLLHGGYWIMLFAAVGTYFDYRKQVLPPIWRDRPELLGLAALFISNVIIGYWLIMLMEGLGLGFDTTMLSGYFRFAVLFGTLLGVAVLSDGPYKHSDQQSGKVD